MGKLFFLYAKNIVISERYFYLFACSSAICTPFLPHEKGTENKAAGQL